MLCYLSVNELVFVVKVSRYTYNNCNYNKNNKLTQNCFRKSSKKETHEKTIKKINKIEK